MPHLATWQRVTLSLKLACYSLNYYCSQLIGISFLKQQQMCVTRNVITVFTEVRQAVLGQLQRSCWEVHKDVIQR